MTDRLGTGSKLAQVGAGGYANILHYLTQPGVHIYGMHPTLFTLFVDANPTLFTLLADENPIISIVFTTMLCM